jgi:phospholipid transport system substrate-binding protein
VKHRLSLRGVVVAALFAIAPAVACLPMLVAAARAEAPAEALGPQELMDSVSKQLFAALDANRAAIKKDPEKAFPLVDTILLPHFDTDYAAQLVLAQSWRTATPDQQKRFVGALYRALLKTYGGAIADFTADRLKLLPFRGDPAATQATVRTLVTRSSGAAVPVDYRLRKTSEGWKAFDVVIEGISYVKNYRTDLGAEVSAKGLDAVIARLEHEGLDVHIAADKPAAAAGKH